MFRVWRINLSAALVDFSYTECRLSLNNTRIITELLVDKMYKSLLIILVMLKKLMHLTVTVPKVNKTFHYIDSQSF